MFSRLVLCGAFAAVMMPSAFAGDPLLPEGYLCCNMRTDGKWISDINYDEDGKHVVPVGTPAKTVDYGRYRVYVMLEGKKQAIGNDYSRTLSKDSYEQLPFAQRYIVTDDPKVKIATYPKKIQDAIKDGRVMRGMTREQVIMSVGYPVTSENPKLDADMWRFWRNSFAEFQVTFDGKGLVKEITTDPATRNLVVAE